MYSVQLAYGLNKSITTQLNNLFLYIQLYLCSKIRLAPVDIMNIYDIRSSVAGSIQIMYNVYVYNSKQPQVLKYIYKTYL